MLSARQIKSRVPSSDDLTTLRNAVLEYLSEIDNPVPDSAMRRVLRDRLRKLTGAPDQPPPRKNLVMPKGRK